MKYFGNNSASTNFLFDKGKVVFLGNEGMLATTKKIYSSDPKKPTQDSCY